MKLINFLVCIVIVGCCEGVSVNKPKSHNRIRRGESDGSNKEQHVSICCGKEAAYPELPADCKALQLSPEEYDTSKWEYELRDACSTECETSHLGVWDGSRIIKDAYLNEINHLYGNDYAEESTVKHFESCIQKAIEINDLLVKNKGPLKCSFVPQLMDYCMYKEVEMHCPDELRSESDKCNNHRETLAAVDISYWKQLAEE